LLPESTNEEIVSLGQGTACWIWNNRKRVPIRYLERSFAVKPPPRQPKRKAPEGPVASAVPPPPKAPRFKPVSNMPHTRDDFLAIPSFSRIAQSQVHLPKAADAEHEEVEDEVDG